MESALLRSRQKRNKHKASLHFEKRLINQGYDLIIGVDEAGRGPLAGPVVAAAVALKKKSFKNYIDDSKRLTCRQREKAYLEIIDKSVFGIGVVNERIIDDINILEATRLAMLEAVSELLKKIKLHKDKPRIHILVDGNVKLDVKFPFTNIIKGDAKSKSIASASILAKVTRDKIMTLYDGIYPEYGFLRHKGYPTKTHRIALKKFGPSLIHRRTFYPVRKDGAF